MPGKTWTGGRTEATLKNLDMQAWDRLLALKNRKYFYTYNKDANLIGIEV